AHGVPGAGVRPARLVRAPAGWRERNGSGARVARRRTLQLRAGAGRQQRRARHGECLGPGVSRSVSDAARHARSAEVARQVTHAAVEAAMERIGPWVRRTPLEYSAALSERLQAEVYFKMECWQVTGSFKPRISFSK